jgi:hypothetical protein
MARADALDRLSDCFDALADRTGGYRYLSECDGRMDWPDRGVYFFFAPEERRADGRRRLTRVGTHAVSAGSGTTLWNRLRTHRGNQRGTFSGGGNHRGSVFRLRVGEALCRRDGISYAYPEWGEGSSADREVRLAELGLERRVSRFIGDLPFLYVAVDDDPGPGSDRARIEQTVISLVSNARKDDVDPRDGDWLGHHSPSGAIRNSGLWNVDHVYDEFDPAGMDCLERWVEETAAP